jgi:hypothetical protein
MKILSDFNAMVGREDIFKLTVGNKILHDPNDDNDFRVANIFHIRNSNCEGTDIQISGFPNMNQECLNAVVMTWRNMLLVP